MNDARAKGRERKLSRAQGRASRGIGRASRRGMTLIEIMIVMVLMSVVLGSMVVGSGQLSNARMKKSATGLSGAIKVAFSRATATSHSERLVFDFADESMWLEEADAPMLVQSKDLTGAAGASPVTQAEMEAKQASEDIIKGVVVPRPAFHPVTAFGIGESSGQPKGPQKLPSPVKFRSIQTAHDDKPLTEGRAYLYFWPGGLTERASIQLRIGDSVQDADTMTLMISPLTGKAKITVGPKELVMPVDDREASEREDTGSP